MLWLIFAMLSILGVVGILDSTPGRRSRCHRCR